MTLLPSRRPLVLLVPVLAVVGSVVASACSEERPSYPRIVIGNDSNQSGSSPTSPSDPDARAGTDAADARSDASAVCTFSTFSSSSSALGCITTESYTCAGTPVTISCDCENTFLCSCGIITTPANCGNPCGGADENIRAQCGVDATRPTPSDAGSDASLLD